MWLRHHAGAWLAPRGYRAFLASLPVGARLLDAGCGNNSPYRVKSQRPDVYYIGLDVGDYNQTLPLRADEYLVVAPQQFAAAIAARRGTLDAVISSHNIEHCVAPGAVIEAMAGALRSGGRLYLAFPSEHSAELPRRGGTLNYRDDPTHLELPRFKAIDAQLRAAGLEITFAAPRYRPLLPRLVGGLLEPWSARRNRVLYGTWAYHGFESMIWARKR
jgi:SAM-dependent methyltransferase